MRPSPCILRCLGRSQGSQPAARHFLSECIPASKRLYHRPRAATIPHSVIVQPLRFAAPSPNSRYASTIPSPPSPPSGTAPESRLERDQVPAYELSFTCKKCSTRSTHRVSKQGYHKGTVLIACPGCKNRHLISDNLKIFSDKPVTIEDLMREKGQLVKRGSLGADGDVEFWDDGTTTARASDAATKQTPDGEDKLIESPASNSSSSDGSSSPSKS